jgi:hypothetical protein
MDDAGRWKRVDSINKQLEQLQQERDELAREMAQSEKEFEQKFGMTMDEYKRSTQSNLSQGDS